MKAYFDTSAFLKILIDEPGSDDASEVWELAETCISSPLIIPEARAALAAARRSGRLTPAHHEGAKLALATLLNDMEFVVLGPELMDDAARLAEREALRAYDAVHLASALASRADFLISSDDALCEAALNQGMAIANPGA